MPVNVRFSIGRIWNFIIIIQAYILITAVVVYWGGVYAGIRRIPTSEFF